MSNCPSCGFAIDPAYLPPLQCPRCGTALGGRGQSPGAPPPFHPEPDASMRAPVMSLPQDTNTAMSQLPDDDDHGPPSIGLDDGAFSQFGGAPPRPPPAARPTFAPPPPPTGGRRPIPAPPKIPPSVPTFLDQRDDSMPGIAEFDLLDIDTGSMQSPDVGDMFDRLGPVIPPPASHARPDHDPLRGIDTPSAVDLGDGMDLPMPADPNRGSDMLAPVDPNRGVDLPAPVELNLPAPAGPSARSQHQPAGLDIDLPAPIELDMLTPVELNLPTPVHADLLTPAHQELRPAGMEVEPSSMQVQPAGLELTPVEVDLPEPAFQELRPADMDLQSAYDGVRPVFPGQPTAPGRPMDPIAAAAAAAAASVGTAGALPAPTRTPSPANKIDEPPGTSRTLYIALGGVVVLTLAGVGVFASGILDVEDPVPDVTVRAKPDAPKPVAEGPAIDRSAEVLAKFSADSPLAYREAIALAEAAGDAAGIAEASLLLHLRYGPALDVANKGSKLIDAYATQKDPFVQRVVGLVALAGGKLDKAEAALTGDETRTQLYRGWLRLRQERPADALADAQAVLATNTGDLAALCLQLAALELTDPAKGLASAQAAVASHPDHPGVLEQAVRMGLRNGHIASARASLMAIALPDDASDGYKARVEALRGDVDFASGHFVNAATSFETATTLAPDLKVSIKRVRALIAGRQFGPAELLLSSLQADNPKATELSLLSAEASIASGQADRALKTLAGVDKALPKDPRVPFLQGQVHAMQLTVDDARRMFAAARERDEKFVAATADDAKLLAKLRKFDEAFALIAAAREAAEEDGRSRDAAELLAVRAKLHTERNERDKALTALDSALALDPGNNDIQLQRGIMRLATRETVDGEADLIAVFERTGGYPGLARPLGLMYVRDNRIKELEALLGDDLAGEATPLDLTLIGARLMLSKDNVAEAKTLISVSLAANPSDWEGHMLLSEAHLREGDPAAALAEIGLARPLDPEAELLLQKGRVLEFNGRYDEARPLYFQATELDPGMHEARWLYGRALQAKGDYTGAIRELTIVVDADTAKATAWYGEAWMVLGIAQDRAGSKTDAIASLTKAVSVNAALGEAHAELGEMYERTNDHGPAIAALEKAVDAGPEDAPWFTQALMNLGRAQNKAGKTAAAKKTFTRFLKLAAPDDAGRPEAQRVVGTG